MKPTEAMRQLLLSIPAVTDIVGTRIYAHRLPEVQAQALTVDPSIAVIEAGSTMRGHSPVWHVKLTLHCVALSEAGALSIASAVFAAIHDRTNLSAAGVRWINCWCEIGPAEKDETTQWDIVQLDIEALAVAS